VAARSKAGAALLVGLVLGWFIAEKGWHRHLGYLVLIIALIAFLRM
jgi:hypothetical protein